MRITRRHRGCDDGTCPAIYDTDDPEMVGVQGAKLTEPLGGLGEVPGHETVVLIPRSLLASWQAQGHDAS
jgi:hypothetical protein